MSEDALKLPMYLVARPRAKNHGMCKGQYCGPVQGFTIAYADTIQ